MFYSLGMRYRVYLSPREAWGKYHEKEKQLFKLKSFKHSGIPVEKEGASIDHFFGDKSLFFYLEASESHSEKLQKVQKQISLNLVLLMLTFLPGMFLFFGPIMIFHVADHTTLSAEGLVYPFCVGMFLVYFACGFIFEGMSLEKQERQEWASLYSHYKAEDFKRYLMLDDE